MNAITFFAMRLFSWLGGLLNICRLEGFLPVFGAGLTVFGRVNLLAAFLNRLILRSRPLIGPSRGRCFNRSWLNCEEIVRRVLSWK